MKKWLDTVNSGYIKQSQCIIQCRSFSEHMADGQVGSLKDMRSCTLFHFAYAINLL